ncbi:hypothetical protein ASPVEDRAFT_834030 [Aspergillus versicolor CBS 583.65]|uniref:AB hydrolase-1 domain-containing protein n=1 Tax=Aspergillus versicolor CBS 583.65 TaxID=1036611 RepID=A0A1L9PUK5_ASPVE|nr:uncharacterized protein ASPVEDRAFT_834030 [Aspergillus versicolor CBS 583.65]OJJ05153.1 hypothetical protein ASPVEDRAFT_834030 [Aspergillus versicolor CBS 583.65]
MAQTPTLLFIHGAWHTRDCWSKVIPALEKHGYRCVAPQVEFSGTETPVTSAAGSINQIQSIIIDETSNGRNVVVINHSLGGVVGCSAVKGFTRKDPSRLDNNSGSVVGIIQLCAFTPPPKSAEYEFFGPIVESRAAFHYSSPDGWDYIEPNVDINDLFYNDLSPEEADMWKGRLVKQSSACVKDIENFYPGWLDVPVSYILTTHDNALPVHAQEALVAASKKAGASITSKRLDSGHSPFLSRVDETVNLFLEAIGEF